MPSVIIYVETNQLFTFLISLQISVAFATQTFAREDTTNSLETESLRVVDILRKRGFVVGTPEWNTDDVTIWKQYDVIVLCNVVNYFAQPGTFEKWLDRLLSMGKYIVNSAEVTRWNMHKTYLRDLESHDVPVPETVYLKATEATLGIVKQIGKDKEWENVVVKPSVGAGSYNCFLYKCFSPTTPSEIADMEKLTKSSELILVQEYLPSIKTEGEYGLVYINGEYSHAVLKRPLADDFRLRKNYNYTNLATIPEAMRQLGDKVHAVLSEMNYDTTYSRIDIVRRSSGELVLLEFEALEPRLFLDENPRAAEKLADVLNEKILKAIKA